MPSSPQSESIYSSVDVGRFPWIRPLAVDYVAAFDRVAAFFAGDPASREARDAAIARAQSSRRPRAEIAAAVTAQLQQRGAPVEAIAAAGRLCDARTVAVVTGQQAGLFGGPVFTLLKAVTAIRLAARLSDEQHVPVVPVFWIDAEDHDWDEVSSCAVLDGELGRRTFGVPAPPGAGREPVSNLRLDGAVSPIIDEVASTIGTTEFSATLFTRLRSAYRAGTGVAEAFGRWLDLLLGERGLVVYDASDPAAKPAVRELFARECADPGRTATLAAKAGRDLVARGYHAQVEPHEGSLALFHLSAGRHPMRLEGAGRIVAGETVRTPTEWAAEALARPDAFSPNVLLRPVVQDALFPTVCYVAGPNELAYLAQLGEVYEHFGVPRPLVVPRLSATVVDSAAAKFLRRYAIPFEQLHRDDESALNHVLEAGLPQAVETALAEVDAAAGSGMERLTAALGEVDPTLEGAARSVRGRIQHELQGLRTRIIHAAKRRDETLRRQFRRTRGLAFPGGHPQERAIGYIYLLNRYGPALVDRLMADVPIDGARHFVVTL